MSRVAVFFLMIVAPALAICLALLGLETLQDNLLGWFLLVTGIAYAAGIVISYYVREERFWESRLKGLVMAEEQADYSFWFITLGMMAAFYLSPLEYLYIAPLLPRAAWMEASGLGLVILGSVLFVWARRILGESYSGHISIKQGQELTQSGPYRFIRHPAYLGYLLMALGLALGYSSLAGLAAIPLILIPTAIFRIRVEDKILAEHFGAQFEEYARKTKRLIPGIW